MHFWVCPDLRNARCDFFFLSLWCPNVNIYWLILLRTHTVHDTIHGPWHVYQSGNTYTKENIYRQQIKPRGEGILISKYTGELEVNSRRKTQTVIQHRKKITVIWSTGLPVLSRGVVYAMAMMMLHTGWWWKETWKDGSLYRHYTALHYIMLCYTTL